MAMKDRLKDQRLKLNMTLEEVASIVGVTRQTVQKYESGVVTNIPSDKIELLAQALKTSPSYLMGWDEVQKPIPNDEDELSPKVREFVQRFQDAGIDLKSMDEADMNKIIALAKIANGK